MLWLLVSGLRVPLLAQAASYPLLVPSALAYDAAGDLFIADRDRNQVFEATLAGTLVTVAGTGTQGFAGDGGPAAAAELNRPQGLAFGPDGTLYIADTGNLRVRALMGGTITTFAGSGVVGFNGDGGPATSASFRSPGAIAMDASGALLVCDTADGRIRRISNGVIATFAGDGIQGFAGDGAAATAAELDSPMGIAAAADGRVWIADTHNQRIRLVTADGIIATFAGTGQRGSDGDGGPAIAAQVAGPRGLILTSSGALLLADSDGERVRSVDAKGVITTLIGSGTEGTSVDGANAPGASLHAPRALAISAFGQPAVSDALNGTVRVLTSAGALYLPAPLASARASTVQITFAGQQVYGGVSGTVVANGVVGVPQGAVSLSDGGTALGTETLAAGQTNWSLPALSAGQHFLSATYRGDGLNPAATLSSFAVNVSPLPLVATVVDASMEYGASAPTLSGTLTGVLPQDAGLVTASFTVATVSPVAVGSYPIAVSLTGPASGNYTVSLAAGSGSLQVIPASTTVTMSTIGSGYAGLPLRLTANVAPATSGKPTGTMQFFDGGSVVATATVVNGSASALYSAPPRSTAHPRWGPVVSPRSTAAI